MKFRIKISGWSEGSRTSFTKTVECPDFVEHIYTYDDDRYGSLKGYSTNVTVEEQQKGWVDAHYDQIVVEECERRFIHPIEGYKIIKPPAVPKKQQVIDLLSQVCEGKDEQYKAMVIGTLAEMWPRLKHGTPESICASVLTSVLATIKIATGILGELNENIDNMKMSTKPEIAPPDFTSDDDDLVPLIIKGLKSRK